MGNLLSSLYASGYFTRFEAVWAARTRNIDWAEMARWPREEGKEENTRGSGRALRRRGLDEGGTVVVVQERLTLRYELDPL
jgi:hypothetical protein